MAEVNEDQNESRDLHTQIKEEFHKGVILGLHHHKQMMTQLIDDNIVMDRQIENYHEYCLQLIEDAFGHSVSEILFKNPALLPTYQKKVTALRRKATSHLSSFVRKHEIFLEDLSKKATQCANAAECLYQDEMEKILNSQGPPPPQSGDLLLAHEECRQKAVDHFQLLCSERGVTHPEIWIFELESKMDEILTDFKNDFDHLDPISGLPEKNSETSPLTPSGLENAEQNCPSEEEEEPVENAAVKPKEPIANEEAPNISLDSVPNFVQPETTLAAAVSKSVEPPKNPPRHIPYHSPSGAPRNLKPPRKSIELLNSAPAPPRPRIDRPAPPRAPTEKPPEPVTKVKKNGSAPPMLNLDRTIANPPEPIQVGIVMDEKSVSVGTFNYRNSGNFMELICKKLATISTTTTTSGVQLCFGEDVPPPSKNKEAHECHFTLWKLLTSDPIKIRKIRVAGTDMEFSNEEMIALFFAHLKFLVESRMSAVVSKVVFALSFFATSGQKERIQDAAILAGFQQILIVSSALATALVEAKSILRSSEPKLICIAEYDDVSLTISVAMVKNNFVHIRAAYQSKWVKSKPVTKIFGRFKTLGGGEEAGQPIRDQIVESLLSKVATQKFKIETADRSPSDGLLVVSNGQDLELDNLIMSKWTHADKKILQSYETVCGASLLAAGVGAMGENIFEARDLELGDVGPWGQSKVGLKSSYNVQNFSVNTKPSGGKIFEKRLNFVKIGINYTVELRESFAGGKEVTVCMYQVTSRAQKKCSVVVTCKVNQSGVYSLHFVKDSTVDVSRISRLLTGTEELSPQFRKFLDQIRQGRFKM